MPRLKPMLVRVSGRKLEAVHAVQALLAARGCHLTRSEAVRACVIEALSQLERMDGAAVQALADRAARRRLAGEI